MNGVVVRLEDAAGAEGLLAAVPPPHARVLIARIDGAAAGVLVLAPGPDDFAEVLERAEADGDPMAALGFHAGGRESDEGPLRTYIAKRTAGRTPEPVPLRHLAGEVDALGAAAISALAQTSSWAFPGPA